MAFLFGFTLLAAGFVGMEEFGHSGFVRTGFPRVAFGIGGYDSFQFIGVTAGVIALPAATTVLTTAAWKSASFPVSLSTACVQLALALFYFGFSTVMYHRWRAENLIQCGFFLCAFYGSDSKKGDYPNGFYQSEFQTWTLFLHLSATERN